MVKITLEIADNGVIKTINDDNINGAGSKLEKKIVYVFEDDSNHKKKMNFFYELAEDLGIDIGNKFEKNNLVMNIGWGNNYTPSPGEVKSKIKKHKLEIEVLENLLDSEDEKN